LASGRINRVILLSDGQANVGVTDTPTLAKGAARAADQGIRITTIGLGLDYNEDLMEALAENGRGQYHYVKDASGLQAVFDGELKAMQATVATNVDLKFAPSCDGVEIEDVYGYETRHDGSQLIVPLADLYGGDHRKVIVRLRAPSNIEGSESLVHATLSWKDARTNDAGTESVDLGVTVTADADAVASAADSDVLAQVEQVQAARTMRRATAMYEKGDTRGALKEIEAQESATHAREQQYHLAPEATAPIYNSMHAAAGVMAAAPADSDKGKDATKKAKAEAMDMSH
jgi:Ca-activated chloride channel family protein